MLDSSPLLRPARAGSPDVFDADDDNDAGQAYPDAEDDDLFEATQTGPATQPQSLPNGTQNEGLDHWGRLLPTNQRSNEPLLLHYDQSTYRIGRNAACDFVFEDVRVSNHHAAFHLSDVDPSGPIVLIEDLKSSNGTYLNGERLAPNKKRVLKHGDDISLGVKPSSSAKAGAGQAGVRLMFISVTKSTMRRCEVFEKYHVGEKIGSGTFAEVKRGMNLETGELVAIKEIQKHKFKSNPKTMQLFEREIEILGALSHPAVCDFIECFEDDLYIYLVLEYIDGGNLLDFIMEMPDPGGIPEADAVDLTRQICVGMAYCHRQGVAHRDLKPENVLLTKAEPVPQAKIADFGLAKMIEESTGTFLKSMVGTPQYLAPEVVLHAKGEGYGQAVDSWSVGIIVYAMLTKLLPFSEDANDTIEVKLQKRSKERVDFTPFEELGVSNLAIDFVGRLLCVNPGSRMSLERALLHPWLRLPEVAAPSALGGNSLPTVTSLPRTAEADASPSEDAMAAFPSAAEDEYSQPFAKLRIEPTGIRQARQQVDGESEPQAKDDDSPTRTEPARPSAPASRFSSSSSSAEPMDVGVDGEDAAADKTLLCSESVAPKMESAPDGKPPHVVHPPIVKRARSPSAVDAAAAVAGPSTANRNGKRKHSPSPPAEPALLHDVFGGSSSLSSIDGGSGSSPREQHTSPRRKPAAAVRNGQQATPVRASPRVHAGSKKANGAPPSAPRSATASLRRSTRRRTTSPGRFKQDVDGEEDGEDEPSPAKRTATDASRASARAASKRRG